MRVISAILMVALVSCTQAQEAPKTSRVTLSPVPFWPQDGDTSPASKGRYVFYDPHSAEYVVHYAPESTGGPSLQPPVLRFGVHSLVDPDVRFTVAPTSDGHFRYTYEVENGVHARQSIGELSILDYSDRDSRASGAQWSAHVEPHSERDLATLGSKRICDKVDIEFCGSIDCFRRSTVQGLAIDSTSLPGFVSMTFQGDSKSREFTPDAVVSLPKEVSDELDSVMICSSGCAK